MLFFSSNQSGRHGLLVIIQTYGEVFSRKCHYNSFLKNDLIKCINEDFNPRPSVFNAVNITSSAIANINILLLIEQNRSFIFDTVYIKATICEHIEENINHNQ